MAWQTLVSAEQVADQLGDPRLLLFDCRYELARPEAGREAYLRGHLPGAVHADLHHDLAGPTSPTSGRHPLPDPQDFAARLRRWGVDDDSLLLAYDDATGMWASRFWWMTAKWLGHRHVAVMDGGMRRWLQLGLPTTTDPAPLRPAGDFAARPDAGAACRCGHDAGGCTRSAAQGARCPRRGALSRRGRTDRPGRGPRARRAQSSIVGRRRCGRPVPAARRAGATHSLARSGPSAPADTITMCGSGVTACHLLLAMEHAGLPGARLYPGSWSEWSRDPARPVARGR